MIKIISKSVANFLCKNEDKLEYYELYEYAAYTILTAILHIVSIFVLGFIFDMVSEVFVFYISFILVRKFAGGYHANTSTTCYLFSMIIVTVIMIALKSSLLYSISGYMSYIYIILSIVCTILICLLSPLDTDNKPLNDKEKIVYKKITIILSLIIFVLSIIFILFKLYNIAFSIILGLLLSSVLLVMRKVQINNNK